MNNKKNKVQQILNYFDPIFQSFKKFTKKAIQDFRKFDQEYPYAVLKIQLLFLYFFAFSSFFYTLCSQLTAISSDLQFIPSFVQNVTQNPFIQFFFSPQRSFFFYLITTEYIIINPFFNFSKFLKYNVLYIIVIQMVQNLILSYLDLILNQGPELPGQEVDYDLDFSESILYALFFYFFVVLFYAFIMSLRNKFAQFPGLQWVTDSVCFWLKIKSPGLKKFFGEKKKK